MFRLCVHLDFDIEVEAGQTVSAAHPAHGTHQCKNTTKQHKHVVVMSRFVPDDGSANGQPKEVADADKEVEHAVSQAESRHRRDQTQAYGREG